MDYINVLFLKEHSSLIFSGQSEIINLFNEGVEEQYSLDDNLLICGQAGLYKWLVVLDICRNGNRKGKPFNLVDCSNPDLESLENDLYGRQGVYNQSESGVLLFENIDYLPQRIQQLFYRNLRENKADVRVISTVSCDIDTKVRQGMFMEGLAKLLFQDRIRVPALSERKDDIRYLAEKFLGKYCKKYQKKINGFEEAVLTYLEEYSWPGNISQLKGVIERLVILGKSDTIDVSMLPVEILSSKIDEDNEDVSLKSVRQLGEKQVLIDILRQYNGNQSKVARSLGVHRNTVLNKVKALDIKPSDYK